jgi:hypothetical protein
MTFNLDKGCLETGDAVVSRHALTSTVLAVMDGTNAVK